MPKLLVDLKEDDDRRLRILAAYDQTTLTDEIRMLVRNQFALRIEEINRKADELSTIGGTGDEIPVLVVKR